MIAVYIPIAIELEKLVCVRRSEPFLVDKLHQEFVLIRSKAVENECAYFKQDAGFLLEANPMAFIQDRATKSGSFGDYPSQLYM